LTRRDGSPKSDYFTASARRLLLIALFVAAVPAVMRCSLGPGPAPSSDLAKEAPTRGTRGLGRDGRWLTYNGRHPWFVGIDFQSAASRRNYDYMAMLDHLQCPHSNTAGNLRVRLV